MPILYEVDRSRDGKSFLTRRVVAIQHGKQIFNLAASFMAPQEGFDHYTAAEAWDRLVEPTHTASSPPVVAGSIP